MINSAFITLSIAWSVHTYQVKEYNKEAEAYRFD